LGPTGVNVARVSSRGSSSKPKPPGSYRQAARALLREGILDALHDLLLTRPWSTITLSDVGAAAGVSRQTIYKEFGPRRSLAQAYGLRLADRLVDAVGAALDANVGEVSAAFTQGFRDYFAESVSDPLVISLLTGSATPDLLRIITVDGGPILARASERLTTVLTGTWVRASEEHAGVLARAIVRLAMSFISVPPEADHDVAAELALLMTPFVDRYGVIETV
jgi:AcrR family transcriptional regulator